MAFTVQPQDLLILYGLLALFFYDPSRTSRKRMAAFYATLQRRIPGAVRNPAVFGIAWSILYALMATSVFLLYAERTDIHPWAGYSCFALVGGILFLSKAWTTLFFDLRLFAVAMADLLVLLLCVIAYIVIAALSDPSFVAGCVVPAVLMAPTALWLIYAGYLNAATLML